MTLLHEAVEAKKLDTRMIERNVARNVIKSEELRTAHQALPDDSDNAQWMSIEALASEANGGGSNSKSGSESDPASSAS